MYEQKLNEIANEYLEKGLIHGSELANLRSEKEFTLWGIENPKLYERTIEIYKHFIFEKKEARIRHPEKGNSTA